MLLRIADKVVHLVLGVLITYAAAEGKHRIDVVAGLQERRQVGGGIARIATDVIGIFQRHTAGLLRLGQIEELLVGVEAFMLGVDAVSQRQGVNRFAVQRQFAAVKIGFLL
ncbi:hypothetical protein D3C79_383930 [compost metagenome]